MSASTTDSEHPRIRFAKRELLRVIGALERVDGHDLNAGIRLMQVEDDLADAREQAARWRRGYESTVRLLDEITPLEAGDRVKHLDEMMRGWIGKA